MGCMLRRLFPFLLSLVAVVAVGAAPTTLSWTTFQASASHTGYVPITVHPKQFSLEWVRSFEGARDLNPVTAADGKVFVSELAYFGPSTNLYVLRAVTGSTIWSVDFGPNFSVNPPSYGYGNVYIQTGYHADNTYLRAYDADTGALVFRSPHAAQWESYYAPTVYAGTVYINGGYYGGMYAFDAFSGERRWFADLPQYDQWTPAVDENWAYAYVGEYSPALYVFDRLTGTPIFSIPDTNFEWNGWSMRLAPVLGEQEDVLAVHDGRLLSFDLAHRNIRWEIQRSFSGQPSLAKGVIYSIDGGTLDARDEETGQRLWGWESPSESLTERPIFVTNSHVFVQSAAKLYAVDLTSHEAVWSYPATGHLTYAEGTLYIAGQQGVLTAIRLRPGRGRPSGH